MEFHYHIYFDIIFYWFYFRQSIFYILPSLLYVADTASVLWLPMPIIGYLLSRLIWYADLPAVLDWFSAMFTYLRTLDICFSCKMEPAPPQTLHSIIPAQSWALPASSKKPPPISVYDFDGFLLRFFEHIFACSKSASRFVFFTA